MRYAITIEWTTPAAGRQRRTAHFEAESMRGLVDAELKKDDLLERLNFPDVPKDLPDKLTYFAIEVKVV